MRGGYTDIAHRLRAGQVLRLDPPKVVVTDDGPPAVTSRKDDADMDFEGMDAITRLNAKVATAVLGWREVRIAGDALIGIPPPGLIEPGEFLADDCAEVPRYASSYAAVRPVIDILATRGWALDVVELEGGAQRARFAKPQGLREVARLGFSKRIAEAIARAACRVQGVEP